MPTTIHRPHDKLFKLSMTELVVAQTFFSEHLPQALLEKVAFDTLKLEKDTFIDPTYRETEADMVYSVKINNAAAYLYLLCEEQTEIDPWFAFRILVYTLRIMELHKKQHPGEPLALVYPMVVYIGEKAWDAPLDFFSLFGEAEQLAREWLFKPCQLIDVQRICDDELYQQTLFGLVAFAMKYRKTSNFRLFLKQLIPRIGEIELHHAFGTPLGSLVIKYVIDQGPEEVGDLLMQEAENYLSETLKGDIMSIAQGWEQKGVQKGVQKGMQKGIQKGEALMLQHLLQKRFGDLPKKYSQQISNANPDILLIWSEKILDAKTLADIFD